MSFWAVVFIVLMIVWLLGGCYVGRGRPDYGPSILGYTILLWACVAILGYIILGAGLRRSCY
jgi:hypothetical protein